MAYCYNCFCERSTPGPCPRCGYDPAFDQGKFPLALPHGSILAGQYITGRVLGQGGFGVTYLALDRTLGVKVAIKEFLPESMAGRSAASPQITAYTGERGEQFRYGLEHFLDEARTLAKFIGNPNIVGVRSYFQENGTAYFVMEYVEGVSLKTYLKNHGGRIEWQEAGKILLPVMDALCAVHREGIIHRDIAPDNIYITGGGTVKLLDFGAARYSLGDRSQSLDVVLKHGYAPKEQYTRRGRQGAYTDVYALAATFYTAITGYVPPDALDRMEEDDLVLPSTRGIRLPAALEDAILQGLEVRAEDRFQTMDAFREAIGTVLAQSASQGEGFVPPTPDMSNTQSESQEERKAFQTKVPPPEPEEAAPKAEERASQGQNRPQDAPPPEQSAAPRRTFPRWGKWAASAACALLILTAAAILWPNLRSAPDSADGESGGGTSAGGVSDVFLPEEGGMPAGDSLEDKENAAAPSEENPSEEPSTGEGEEEQPSSDSPPASQQGGAAAASSEEPSSQQGSGTSSGASSGASKPSEKPAASVSFSDEIFEKCIRTGLNKSSGAVTASDLAGIQSLTIYRWNDSIRVELNGKEREFDCSRSQSIQSLSDVSKLTGCTILSISDQSFSSLSALSSMTQLRSLTIENCGVSDISALSKLTGLTTLNLEGNSISDISALSSLKNLTILEARNNQISDISALSGMTKLRTVDLWYNSISDLSPLSGLKSLDFIDMGGNQISDLTPLSGLTGLTKLTLSSNAISDITPLAGLTKLEKLTLYGNQVSDLRPLSGMTEMRDLRLMKNPITDVSPLAGMMKLETLQVDDSVTDFSPLAHLPNLDI